MEVDVDVEDAEVEEQPGRQHRHQAGQPRGGEEHQGGDLASDDQSKQSIKRIDQSEERVLRENND